MCVCFFLNVKQTRYNRRVLHNEHRVKTKRTVPYRGRCKRNAKNTSKKMCLPHNGFRLNAIVVEIRIAYARKRFPVAVVCTTIDLKFGQADGNGNFRESWRGLCRLDGFLKTVAVGSRKKNGSICVSRTHLPHMHAPYFFADYWSRFSRVFRRKRVSFQRSPDRKGV